MGLNAQVITCLVAIGNRGGNPVNVQADEVKKLPCHDGDFRCINSIGTENRTPTAFSTLEKIVPHLLEYVQGQGATAAEASTARDFG